MKRTRWIKISLYTISLVIILIIISLKPMPKEIDYQETNLFKKTNRILSKLEFKPRGINTPTKTGWAKKNITPAYPLRLAGYGLREKYDHVIDSIYARCLVFKQNQEIIAYLSYDLLIVPPALKKMVLKELKKDGIEQVYFTAIHTHSSVGGIFKDLGSQVVFGRYDKKYTRHVARQTRKAVKEALSGIEPYIMATKNIPTRQVVKNHLDKNSYNDSTLRAVFLRTVSGKTALLSVLSVHGTYLHPGINGLSSGFPGEYNRYLESKEEIDFSIYSAGAVAGQKPVVLYETKDSITNYRNYHDMLKYSRSLADVAYQNMTSLNFKPSSDIDFKQIDVPATRPLVRISENLSLRGWIVYALVGKPKHDLTYFRLGNNVFIGAPGDISGEFYPGFRQLLETKKINLVLTSFNGEYAGYIIPDHYYYSSKKSEAREMNWFGPLYGSHHEFIIGSILEKL